MSVWELEKMPKTIWNCTNMPQYYIEGPVYLHLYFLSINWLHWSRLHYTPLSNMEWNSTGRSTDKYRHTSVKAYLWMRGYWRGSGMKTMYGTCWDAWLEWWGICMGSTGKSFFPCWHCSVGMIAGYTRINHCILCLHQITRHSIALAFLGLQKDWRHW